MAQQVDFWLYFVLVTTLTFDLSISKSNQFISVSKSTWTVNFVKFRQAVCEISCIVDERMHSQKDRWTNGQSSTVLTAQEAQKHRMNKMYKISTNNENQPDGWHLHQISNKNSHKNYCQWALITQRRSVVKSVEYFHSVRLFVCFLVCLFVDTITSKRVNIGRWNLKGRCTVQNLGRVRIWGS